MAYDQASLFWRTEYFSVESGTQKQFTLSFTPKEGTLMCLLNGIAQPCEVFGNSIQLPAAVSVDVGDTVMVFYGQD